MRRRSREIPRMLVVTIPTREFLWNQKYSRHPEGRCDASVFFSSLADLRDLALRRQ
jgi:hypothetical protein